MIPLSDIYPGEYMHLLSKSHSSVVSVYLGKNAFLKPSKHESIKNVEVLREFQRIIAKNLT